MMGNFLVAWLVGLSLHIAQGAYEWKYTTSSGKFPLTFASPLPPKPGQLMVSSGIYIGLAILAQNPSMRSLATLTAWGYNVAIGLSWAQNYSVEKGSQKNGAASGGTWFWAPPTTASNNLFPTGKGMATPTGAPTSPNGGTASGGNLVA